ncbi:MAG TPA: malate synthase A [Thermoanaerobaculia bacterium]|nr:malate synthase A [Thermoanaerobaculia bacterium]
MGRASAHQARVLTPAARDFVAGLDQRFDAVRKELLSRRERRQVDFDRGSLPDFDPSTHEVREGSWRVAPAPADLEDRRVEITGPVERKMMINALNSGASVFMADFEDALSPTWANVVEGQANLMDAVRRTLDFRSPDGKEYRLNDKTATLLVRPRGWHLHEKHFLVDGLPVSASLFDFGLYFFHNAKELLDRGSGPYFYLPKLESHTEAELWNEVFNAAQDALGLPRGSIRATVLIENVLAAFEMEEILFALRDHAAGLNAGRWDYIFSIIRKFRASGRLFPDRSQVTMAVPFMRAYTDLLVKTCHRRGAHAIGGMAAFIPSRRDEEANERALSKVREDKEREAAAGFDGTWVAHPDLVPVAKETFDRTLSARAHQKERTRDEVHASAAPLLDFSIAGGRVTEEGVRDNVRIALQYLDSWLQGYGAVAINNLMEDTATAEISRVQLWQWLWHGATLPDGRKVDHGLYRELRDQELAALGGIHQGRLADASTILDELVLSEDFVEFLTIPAYDLLGTT